MLTAAASVKGNIDFILFLAFDCLQRKFLNNSFIILGRQIFILKQDSLGKRNFKFTFTYACCKHGLS